MQIVNRISKLKGNIFNNNQIIKGEDKQNNNIKIYIGLALILLSLILPKIIQVQQFNIIEDLYGSISNQDSGLLLIVSAKLVLLNTVRHLPIYAGAFLLAEGLYSLFGISYLGFTIPLITIPIIYKLISIIYNMSFIFAGPSLLTIVIIFVIHLSTKNIKPIFIKILIISLYLFGFDWLDIVPMLYPYGFGRGEISSSIRQITEFIGSKHMLNFVGMTFAIIIISNAVILTRVVWSYFNRLILVEESRKKEKRLRKIEVEAVKSRYLQEVKHLVHDLKTPLVTIQGLSGVIGLRVQDEKVAEYSDKIVNASENMSAMISEILYNDKMHKLRIGDLIDFIKIELSLENNDPHVKFDINPDLKIFANKIRLSRAIINLIDNGLKASKSDTESKVFVTIAKSSNRIKINISDNGMGIARDNLDKIWEAGYTTDGDNTGLGLNFVKKVIDDHGGVIRVESELGCGTEINIYLPEVE